MTDLPKVADAVPSSTATATAATAPPPPPLTVHEKGEHKTSSHQPPPLPAHTVRAMNKGRVGHAAHFAAAAWSAASRAPLAALR